VTSIPCGDRKPPQRIQSERSQEGGCERIPYGDDSPVGGASLEGALLPQEDTFSGQRRENMVHVVSVSIGSSKRDHRTELRLLGRDICLERIGTDGDLKAAIRKIKELDGTVDAIGLGGIDLYVWAGNRRYMFRDAKRIARSARFTPVADGSGLKNSWENHIVRQLFNDGVLPLRGNPGPTRVLMVSAIDRLGMARSLCEHGCDMIIGDVMFALGMNFPVRNLRTINLLGHLLLPFLSQMPFKILYPTGEKQETSSSDARFAKHFEWADVVAGDFHFIKRHMPSDMTGKIVLTNTVTADDVDELRKRGVKRLITTTPDLGGRSFGTNVMEALIVALAGKRPEEIRRDEFVEWFSRLGFCPRIEELAAAPR